MPKTQALPVKRDTEEVMYEHSPAAKQGHHTCRVGVSRANVKESSNEGVSHSESTMGSFSA